MIDETVSPLRRRMIERPSVTLKKKRSAETAEFMLGPAMPLEARCR